MLRDVVKIDEDLCNGCGECIPGCHEGALQIIDNKARLVSDLMCDGLGACIGHCPQGAISVEKREAEPYNETKVMQLMVEKGKNTVIAHLVHLKEHNEGELMAEGLSYLRKNQNSYDFSLKEVMTAVHNSGNSCASGGCPGSQPIDFSKPLPIKTPEVKTSVSGESALTHWPVQMHLINPAAAYYKNTDLMLAADCVAFSMGNFHQDFLKGKSLAIACPKLDSGLDVYVDKITRLIDEAKVNTITVMMMQVPCCGGLTRLVQMAVGKASRKVPVKAIVISTEGKVLSEEWM